MNELRKYGITDAVLEEICKIAKQNPDPASMLDETRDVQPGTEELAGGPYYMPVSVTACKAAKKPKKIWNSFIKMNIYNFVSANMKPEFYTFICKAYNGQLFNVDIKKQPWLTYKRAVEIALAGLADQILELKMIELAAQKKAQEERQAEIKAKLGDVKLDLPEGMEMSDDLIDSIGSVLEEIKAQQADDGITDAEIISETKRGVSPLFAPIDESAHVE